MIQAELSTSRIVSVFDQNCQMLVKVMVYEDTTLESCSANIRRCDHVVSVFYSNRACPFTERSANRLLGRVQIMAELGADISKLYGRFSSTINSYDIYTVEPIYQVKLLSALRSGIHTSFDRIYTIADRGFRRPRCHSSISCRDQQG